MLPAAGQGALAVEVMAHRQDLMAALAPLAHGPTWLAVTAERAVSREMGGSCSMPLAAHAVWHGATLQIDAAWGEVGNLGEVAGFGDGRTNGATPPLVRATGSAAVTTPEQARLLGQQVARQLCARGAVRTSAQRGV